MGIQMTTGDDETAVGNHDANEGKEIWQRHIVGKIQSCDNFNLKAEGAQG